MGERRPLIEASHLTREAVDLRTSQRRDRVRRLLERLKDEELLDEFHDELHDGDEPDDEPPRSA